MAEKKGLIQRWIVGKDRDDNYARSTLPSNRRELLWDIIKGRFWKLVLLNLMLIVACVPAFLILFMQSQMTAIYGSMLPFSGGLFVGYPFIPDLYQLMFLYEFRLKIDVFLLLIPCLMFAALIFAGVFYIFRNLVWSEAVFIANDFWKGFKTNFFHFVLIAFFLGILFFLSSMNIAIINQSALFSPDSFLSKGWVSALLKGLTYVIMGFFIIMALFAFTTTVTYKLSFRQLIKNSFILTLGLLPRNIIFAALSFLPFLLLLIFGSGLLSSLLLGLILMLGFSFAVLLWSIYSHWVFDTFINDKVEGAVKNKGLYEKVAHDDKDKKSYFKNPKKKKVKPVTDEEISITELPTNFSRADLAKLAEEKEFIKQEGEKWAAEHINDMNEDDEFNEDEELNEEDTSAYDGYEDAMKLEGYEGEESLPEEEDEQTDEPTKDEEKKDKRE